MGGLLNNITGVFLLFLFMYTASGGDIYKCKQKDGTITYSNIQCPDDTIKRDNISSEEIANESDIGETSLRPGEIKMLRRLEEEKAIKKARRKYRKAHSTSPHEKEKQEKPLLTYEQARKKALHDAGYQNYGNLTGFQRESVDREMEKYNYLPRTAGKHRGIGEDNDTYANKIMEEQNKRAEEVEQAYRREKRLRDVGVPGRDVRYDRAVKDCRFTPGAFCR